MARYSHFDYYQQPSSLDVPPEEDDMSVLDDKILDSTSPGLADPRRASYDTQDAFSHRNSVWSNYSSASSESRPTSHLGQSVLDSANPSFMPIDGPQPYTQPTAGWALSRTASGSCTPTAYDQYPSEEGTSSAPFSGGAVGPVNSMPMGAVSYRGGMGFAPSGGVAMSPQSSQGWMPAPMDLADAAAQSKSAAFRNGSPLTMRRDGIRKKNARFEIPAERTLSNIDHLISQSNNEEEIKELKQQKRLLRNRQAALDSRQRKKLHTEKLEEEKKHFTNAIGHLEDMVNKLRSREAELIREKTEWINQQQHMTNYLESIHIEKNEMIRVHTLETAELRKKNNILMETVEKLERGVPKQVDTHADFTGFENLSMENHPWEDFNMGNGISMQEPIPAQQQQALQVSERSEKSTTPFSWNAFYMCLLFGAYIASNNSSIPGRSLPQLSEEYRAESANVLKAVLASSPNEFSAVQSQGQVPTAMPSGPSSSAIPTMEMAPMAQVQVQQPGSSTLDELHDTLVMPTEDQQRAQVFALNPDQYNQLTSFDDEAFKPQQPSNLQQALAAMRSNAAQHRMGASSDVYSRSLMWDRVPEKVIRDFRRMVHEYGAPVKEEMVGFASA
ncbi:hypothetical protein N7509_004079 [Penicillium cosmopolitanum]|uniref:BZIP domain-containing protein n=1 Tax=Penicillium cosmopolitanum TaxID=1131564 RepID=A0A9W9W682_9EURO|nr:uncharacterized protein N7509_004079 [Penicillium cosmopolitanum]KAJ5404208.1 hypothetical protein N7509_004079 [Penicillium cosmopolitanum]